MKVEIRFFAGGWCSAPGVLAGGHGLRRVHFPALVAWIRHPNEGEMLFDTGYSHEGLKRMRTFPSSILATLLQPSLAAHEELAERLRSFGSSIDLIRRLFVSHFHYDHASALKLFPKAEFITHREAWQSARAIPRMKEGPYAFSSVLIPPDFASRATLLEVSTSVSWEGFPHTWDLFGDGSLRAVDLPGHAPGQVGLVVNSVRGQFFLVADAVWLLENLTGEIPPWWVMRLTQDSVADWHRTLELLKNFTSAHPEIRIMPSHCARSLAELA